MPSDECCFTTFCEQCDEFKLEDSVGWDQPVSNKSIDIDEKTSR